MRLVLLLIFLLSITESKSQECKVFNSINISDRYVKICFIDSSTKCDKSASFQILKGQHKRFRFNKDIVYYDVKVDSLDIISYINRHFVFPNSPPGVLPIVYVGFIIDEKGKIIARGLQRGSVDKEFSKQMLDIVRSYDGAFPIVKMDGHPVSYLYTFNVNIYDITE